MSSYDGQATATDVIPQRVYFDPEDEAMDGNGWNVVDRDGGGGVAARYPTWSGAFRAAQAFALGLYRPSHSQPRNDL